MENIDTQKVNYFIRKSMFHKNNKMLVDLLKKYNMYVYPNTSELLKYYKQSNTEQVKRIKNNNDKKYPMYVLSNKSKNNFKKYHKLIKKDVYHFLENTPKSHRLGDKLSVIGGKESRNLILCNNKTKHFDYLKNIHKLLLNAVKSTNSNYELVSMNISLMYPRTHIVWHKGFENYSEYVTRHIYGIDVPDLCSLNTLNQIKQIKENDFIHFQDINNHEAWNFSDKNRLVMIFDITHKKNLKLLENSYKNVQNNDTKNNEFTKTLKLQLNNNLS